MVSIEILTQSFLLHFYIHHGHILHRFDEMQIRYGRTSNVLVTIDETRSAFLIKQYTSIYKPNICVYICRLLYI